MFKETTIYDYVDKSLADIESTLKLLDSQYNIDSLYKILDKLYFIQSVNRLNKEINHMYYSDGRNDGINETIKKANELFGSEISDGLMRNYILELFNHSAEINIAEYIENKVCLDILLEYQDYIIEFTEGKYNDYIKYVGSDNSIQTLDLPIHCTTNEVATTDEDQLVFTFHNDKINVTKMIHIQERN